MFDMFINDSDSEAECMLRKLADGARLGGVAYTPEDSAVI